MSALPFKYREKRNAYFKEYMRKWRAEKRNQNLEPDSFETQKEGKENKSYKPKEYEILAA
jgi:hypothetical protein